jgi:hypothetical protein
MSGLKEPVDVHTLAKLVIDNMYLLHVGNILYYFWIFNQKDNPDPIADCGGESMSKKLSVRHVSSLSSRICCDCYYYYTI